MSLSPLLDMRNLKTYFFTRRGAVRAVDDVTLQVRKGETLGLVGESGCGKSTLGLSILRLVPPPGRITGGHIFFNGEDLLEKSDKEMRKIRGKDISMIFQDPMTSLNPVMKVSDHLVEVLMTHDESIEARDALDQSSKLLSKLGIPSDRLKDYPHQLSGGMRQRVMIALALILNPALIIADEPTTALDTIVQAQILELTKKLKRDYNIALILITHDLSVTAELTDRIAVMYAGKLVEVADSSRIYEKPLHPYTQGLMKSIPNIELSEQKLGSIPGFPPDLLDPPPGCRFHPRCPYREAQCREKEPPPIDIEARHMVSCLLYV